jgi:hypothetical protein
MPRIAQITHKDKNGERAYTLTYLDDSPERQEAIQFFQRSRGSSGLFPALNIPEIVSGMPRHAAQEYLDAHPIQEQWSLLAIREGDGISDDDLIRLRYIPEIHTLNVFSNRITDLGVRHVCFLRQLKHLALNSTSVTDACLDDITNIRTLLSLDMQMSRRVSRSAYLSAVKRLPSIVDSYPPFEGPLPKIFSGSPFLFPSERTNNKGDSCD